VILRDQIVPFGLRSGQ